MELKYIGECEHLDNWSGIKSLRCKKRFFNVFNPVSGKYERIAFCNDYLKLHMQHHINQFDHCSYDVSNGCKHELTKLIRKAINLEGYDQYLATRKQPVIRDISFLICHRPFVHVVVPFREAVEWYLKNHNSDLWYELKDAVIDFMYSKERYKKYKTVCHNLSVMVNKLKHTCYTQDELLINDILLLILKIIYNETNQQQVTTALPVRPNGKTRQARSNGGRSKSASTLSEASQQCPEV
jgi:hypothetical protein